MSVRIPTFEEILAVSHSRGGMSYAPGLWDGLVGAWPLQEGGGLTAFDASGYSRHGTLTNMDPATDHVVTEKGWALDFDGTNDWVQLVGSSIPSIFSVSALVNIGATNSAYRILLNNNAIGGMYLKDRVLLWYQGADKAVGSSTIPTSTWTYVAITSDGATLIGYVNGVAENSVVYSSPGISADLGIGGAGVGQSFNGLIDDVHIYKRVLSVSEIAQLYADPWAMYRQRRRVFAAATGAPSAGKPTHFMYYQRLRRAG